MEGVVTEMKGEHYHVCYLSIAIPVYNQASTIQSAIQSALDALGSQEGVEIVVSENHSDDGTAEIVAKFSDKVRIVQPPTHLGMAANWNFAVNSCRGKWVGMLSGDDKILPGYVQQIRKITSRRHDAVFAYGGWRTINVKTGQVAKRVVLSMPSVSRPKHSVAALMKGPKASFASYCFLKTAFERIGGFPTEYELIQDWVMQFRLSFLGELVKTNAVIAEYTHGQDRPDLESLRVALYVKDMVLFCTLDIWRACELAVPRRAVLNVCELIAARAQDLLDRNAHCGEEAAALMLPLLTLIGKERVQSLRCNRRHGISPYLREKLRVFIQLFS